MTTNFQVGDKIKAGPFTADLGLTPGNIYTVHHVDDFGLVQPDGVRHDHYHPSHFKLVERAASTIGRYGVDPDMPCYSLKDGDGDWWVYTTEDPAAEGYWCLVNAPSVVRSGSEGGAQEIGDVYGIDAEPLPAAAGVEVYEPGADERIIAWRRLADHPIFKDCYAEERPLIEAMMAKLDRIYSEGYEGKDVESDEPKPRLAALMAEPPVWADDPAPLQPGDWVKVLARVEHVYDNGSISAHTFQSDGSRNGGALYAIASAITRTDEVPEWAQEPERREEPTALGTVVYSETAAKLYTRASICMGETHVWANNVDRCWSSWEQLPDDVKVVDPETLTRGGGN